MDHHQYDDDSEDQEDAEQIMYDTTHAAGFDAERQFYSRFAKFLALLSLFITIMFLAAFEHMRSIFLLMIGGFATWLIFIIGRMAYTVLVVDPQNDIRNIMTQAELQDMEARAAGSDEEEDMEGGGDGVGRMAVFSFDETPTYVRSCREEIRYLTHKPKNGRYKIVYNAVYFGKSIRSESNLQLQFVESSGGNNNSGGRGSNGWEVKGTIFSGKHTNPQNNRDISEGFLNGRGEMYWKLNNIMDETMLDGIYRGLYDFRSCVMHDGEFKAGTAPPGRIVRMQLMEEGEASPSPRAARDNKKINNSDDDGWGEMNLDDVEMVDMKKDVDRMIGTTIGF